MKQIVTFIIGALCFTAAQSDLEIVIADQTQQVSTLSSNGKKARINNSQEPGYMLIDFKSSQIHMVDPQRKEAMIMSSNSQAASETTKNNVKIKLIKKKKGPKIAGYKTRQYNIQVNKKHCGTIYGSKKVLKKKGFKDIVEAMSQLQQQSANMMGKLGGLIDECELAQMQLSQFYTTTGAPMRLIDEQGVLESEVQSVNSKAKFSKAHYQIPADYKIVDMQQKMQQAQQQTEQAMQQMNENMPDMNQLMQQMQSSEGMPPDFLDKMKKMQEQFKQQLQPQ